MKLSKLAGATSDIWQIFVRDSSSTTGGGLTGLVFNSPGLTAYYHRDTDTTATAISLVTMTVGTFTSSGFKEIDATNMPGWYQFCPPNASIASGAKSCGFHLKGVTNMAPLPIEVQLTAYNPDVALATASALATVQADTDDIQTRLPAALTAGGNMKSDALAWAGAATATDDVALVAAPANFAALAITAGGAVTAGTISDKTGYALTAAYDAAKTASQAGDAMALTGGERTALTAVIWAFVVTGTTTAVQAMRGFIAAMLGKSSGLDTLTPKYRNIADTKNVIDATTDADGNRTAVTLDLS